MVASYLIQKPRTGTLCLSGSMGADVHRCADIRMTQQFLHILGSSPIRKKIAGERVTEYMEVEVLKTEDFFLCAPAHQADGAGWFDSSIGPKAYEGQAFIHLRCALCSG